MGGRLADWGLSHVAGAHLFRSAPAPVPAGLPLPRSVSMSYEFYKVGTWSYLVINRSVKAPVPYLRPPGIQLDAVGAHVQSRTSLAFRPAPSWMVRIQCT